MPRRWEWFLMLAVAFAARVAAGLHLGHFAHPHLWEYEEIANNLLAGKGYLCMYMETPYRALCPPGYPFFCAAVYALTGHSQTALLLLQCLLGALLCIPVRKIGLLALSPASAALGAWAVALHPPLIHFASRLHTLTLDVLLYMMCLWSWLAFHRRPTGRRAIATGIASGMALLFRTTLAPFILLAAALSSRFTGLSIRTLWPKLAAVFLAAGLLLAPWLARNAFLFGKFPMFVSSSNLVLWIGNNPNANGGALMQDGRTDQLTAAPKPFLEELRRSDEIGQNRMMGESARKFIRENPLRAIRLYGIKLRSFFWFSPQTGVLYPEWQMRVYRWYYGGMVLLMGLGLWAIRRRWSEPPILLLSAYILSIALLQCLFFVEGRHRWTVEPLFLLFAAEGLLFLKQRILSFR